MTVKNFTLMMAMFLGMVLPMQAQTVILQEDFDGAIPNDWTVVKVLGNDEPSAEWVWSSTGPAGGFAIDTILSPTAANGFALFDSDLNCAGPAVGQDAWLISPALDASALTEVYLNFYTYYREYNNDAFIRVGTDISDLNSWTTFDMFEGLGVNDFSGVVLDANSSGAFVNPHRLDVDISAAAAGQPAFYVAFQFISTEALHGENAGCGYAWQVDDVTVSDESTRPANDVTVNEFYTIAPNFATPKSQITPMVFLADVMNNGTSDQDRMALTLTIEDTDLDSIVYRDSVIYLDVASDSLAENVFFSGTYTPPAEAIKVYNATYSLSIEDDDEVIADNEKFYSFVITDTIYTKENGPTTAITPSDDPRFSYGNIYYVRSATDEDGEQLYARYISFGVENPSDLVDRDVTINLYKVDDPSVLSDGLVTAEDLGSIPIAFNQYRFTDTDESGLFTMPIDIDGNGVALEDDTHYFLSMEYNPLDDQDLFIWASTELDYQAMIFQTDSMENVVPQFGSALRVGDPAGDHRLIGFGYDYVPVIRMSIGGDIMTSVREPELPTTAAKLFPNPANEATSLKLSLESPSEFAEVQLFDITGKLIKHNRYGSVQHETIELTTSELAVGSYQVRLRTEAGVRTFPLQVQR